MSEKAELLQGIRLRDHVKRVCAKCKIKVDPATVVCPKCQKVLPAPVVLPSFREEIENALRFALAGQLSINARGEIDETVKMVPRLAAYLIWATNITGLDAAINFGFPRLLAECDALGSLYPDLKASLPATRVFLNEQQALATTALARLRQEPVTNNLEGLFNEYQEVFARYAAEQEKTGGNPTTALDAAGEKLIDILTKMDFIAQILGTHGQLWVLQGSSMPPADSTLVKAEWEAILFAISHLANFPINLNYQAESGGV